MRILVGCLLLFIWNCNPAPAPDGTATDSPEQAVELPDSLSQQLAQLQTTLRGLERQQDSIRAAVSAIAASIPGASSLPDSEPTTPQNTGDVKAYVLDIRYEFALMSDVTERARAEFRRQGLIHPTYGALSRDATPPGGDGRRDTDVIASIGEDSYKSKDE